MCLIWRLEGTGEDEKDGTELKSFGLDSSSKPVRPKEKRGVDANCCCGCESCRIGVRNFWFGRRRDCGVDFRTGLWGFELEDGRNR